MKIRAEYALISSQVSELSNDMELARAPGVRNVVRALIVAEDRRFCSHWGVDWRGILRAAFRFVAERKLEGASTIEQQLVRTIRGRYEVTLRRKFSECALAWAISARFNKEQLAFSYLRVGYFGWKANGVIQAAKRLGVDLENACESEAAAIAAMLKVPMPRLPSKKYIRRHAQRVAYILDNWSKVEKRNGFPF